MGDRAGTGQAASRNRKDAELGALFESAAAYLSLLSEPTRMRILHAVCYDERSVGDIVRKTGISQTNVSRHLALMWRAKVLGRRRSGSTVYYSIADPTLIQICRSVCIHVSAGLAGKPGRSRAERVFPPRKAAR